MRVSFYSVLSIFYNHRNYTTAREQIHRVPIISIHHSENSCSAAHRSVRLGPECPPSRTTDVLLTDGHAPHLPSTWDFLTKQGLGTVRWSSHQYRSIIYIFVLVWRKATQLLFTCARPICIFKEGNEGRPASALWLILQRVKNLSHYTTLVWHTAAFYWVSRSL